MGNQHQKELLAHAKKNGIGFKKSMTMYEITSENLQLESKTELKKFVADVSKTKSDKKIEDVAFVIVWDSKLTAPQKKIWDLRPPVPAEKLHPRITHILESRKDPSKNTQVISLSEFF